MSFSPNHNDELNNSATSSATRTTNTTLNRQQSSQSLLLPPNRFASSLSPPSLLQQQQRFPSSSNAAAAFVEISNDDVTRISAAAGLIHLPPDEREGIITTYVNESERLRYEYDEVLESSWYPQEPLMVDPEDAEWALRNYYQQSNNSMAYRQQQMTAANNNNNNNNSSDDAGNNNNNNNDNGEGDQQHQQPDPTSPLYGTSNSMRIPSAFLAKGTMGGGGAGGARMSVGGNRIESVAGAALTMRASLRHPTNQFKSYSINFDTWQNLYITIAKRTFYIHLPTTISVLIGILLLYTFLLLTMGDSVAPGGELFDPIVAVVFSGMVGGSLALLFSIPPLVGILWTSILWGNIADRSLVQGITKKITSPVKMVSLTMILLTGGLSINWNLVKPMKWSILLLATIPLSLDLVGNFLTTSALFNFDSPNWAFLMSATLAPISASVVVASCIYVQSTGRGNIGGGPLIILLTAVPLESSIGIFIATFQQRLVLEASDSHLAAYLAPLQIIGGVVAGVSAGFLLNAITDALDENRFLGGDASTFDMCSTAEKEKFERKTNRRLFCLILAVAGTGMLIAKHFELEGAGSLFVVSLGATLAHFWNKNPHTRLGRKKHISVIASSFWNLIALPALYTFVGVSVHVDQVFNATFFWKGLCCYLSSVCWRFLGSSIIGALSPGLSNLSTREKIVLSIGFTGKASAQATLALMVYDKAKDKLAALTPMTAEYDAEKKILEYGQIIANTSIIMILFAAPSCAILMKYLGVRWVRKDVPN